MTRPSFSWLNASYKPQCFSHWDNQHLYTSPLCHRHNQIIKLQSSQFSIHNNLQFQMSGSIHYRQYTKIVITKTNKSQRIIPTQLPNLNPWTTNYKHLKANKPFPILWHAIKSSKKRQQRDWNIHEVPKVKQNRRRRNKEKKGKGGIQCHGIREDHACTWQHTCP